MAEIILTIQEKPKKTRLSDDELDDPLGILFGMPLETHEYDGVGEKDDEDYSISGRRSLPMNLPPRQLNLPVAINDAYVRYGRVCKSKISDKGDLTELAREVGCDIRQLEEIFIGSYPLSGRLFKRLNEVLRIGPYELKHNHAKIF